MIDKTVRNLKTNPNDIIYTPKSVALTMIKLKKKNLNNQEKDIKKKKSKY